MVLWKLEPTLAVILGLVVSLSMFVYEHILWASLLSEPPFVSEFRIGFDRSIVQRYQEFYKIF